VPVQKTQKVLDPAASADAVLSQSLSQQVDDFTAREFDAFNQAHDHPHVGQHRRVGHARLVQHYVLRQFGRRRRCRSEIVLGLGLRGLAALAAGIEPLLLRLPGRRPVIRGAALAGTLSAVVLPTAKRAP
jgi:hypothetical protein